MPIETASRESLKGRRHDFDRLLPMLAGGLLSTAGVILFLLATLSRHTAPWNPLMVYGMLIAGAGLVSAVLARTGWRRTAWTLVLVTGLDLAFGLATHAMATLGLRNSFLPMKTISLKDTGRFTWHPLLQGVPTPGFDNGFFIHDTNGRRKVIPQGTTTGPRIAVIGGSSTYDLGVRAGRTWPDHLQRLIPEARILNYGVPGYSTSEHIIQTAYYLAPAGIDCAVYYIGWNDIRNSFLPTLDPAYADYHLLGHVDFMRIRSVTGVSSIYNFLANSRFVRRFTSFIPVPADYRGWKPKSGIDRRLERIYRRNLHTLKALNDSQERRTVFIPQILNYARLTAPTRYGWFPLVADRDVPPINEHFNRVLKEESARLGVSYVDITPAMFEDADFVDNGHFSERGAEKFAGLVAPAIRKACLPER